MANLTRRTLLMGSAASLVLIGAGTFAGRRDAALALAEARAVSVLGTTMEAASAPVGTVGYRRLGAGPGMPTIVRSELRTVDSRRDDRRDALAAFVQLTDLHIVDAQSPMRFESFLDVDKTAFRPQEALGTHGTAQLVRRINDLAAGPFTGRGFDCAVTTGDNTDNGENIELEWFLTLMNGGELRADTGAVGTWEGVQSGNDERFYRPGSKHPDAYQKVGFPIVESMLDHAMVPHASDGLTMPWYCVFGNHDDSIGGTVPAAWTALTDAYTGATKFTGFRDERANRAVRAAFEAGMAAAPDARAALDPRWTVTADERRAPFTPAQFMAAHLASSAEGAGPVGHGFTSEAIAQGRSWYRFDISDSVVGLALDSTDKAGFTYGSIGDAQLTWLESELAAASDHYVVVFSHHTSRSMTNLHPDPRTPGQKRHHGDEIVGVLSRHPNVIAWVNGHSHSNRITPHPGASPRHSFWEINTASHIDFPQQARVIEVCRDGSGSMSIFTTLIESAAPQQASYSDGSQAALASLYRELSYNDVSYASRHAGSVGDRNTELLLADPFG
ncbi:MAG TPA: TIGR03767 family metallophosphoesterase [Humibacter sp.]|nr:TIGR03767 family metallophosphoesterase [Humibacter sp.]